MKGEISYDLGMDDDMSFVEGTYRLAGGEWQVFIFSRCPAGELVEVASRNWGSGVSGTAVQCPKSQKLNKAVVQ